MKFLNLNLEATYDSPEFTGSEPVNRSTWFCLMCYCAKRENGGRIEKCKAWGERRWPQEAKLFKAEVMVPSELWAWDGEDLVVSLYPKYQEVQFKTMRENGRIGGIRSGQSRAATAKNKDSVEPPIQASNEGTLKGGLEGGLERKGKGKEKGIETDLRAPAHVERKQTDSGSGSSSTTGKKIQIRGYGDIGDTAHDPIDLASTITGDFSERGRGYWRIQLDKVGQGQFRSQLNTLWGQHNAGEHAKNAAAILTARLNQIIKGTGKA